jgi:hypothetical protein
MIALRHQTVTPQIKRGHRTFAGGGDCLLSAGKTYRMRNGEIATVHPTATFSLLWFSDSRRRWLPTGHFLGEHITHSCDLVELITLPTGRGR